MKRIVQGCRIALVTVASLIVGNVWAGSQELPAAGSAQYANKVQNPFSAKNRPDAPRTPDPADDSVIADPLEPRDPFSNSFGNLPAPTGGAAANAAPANQSAPAPSRDTTVQSAEDQVQTIARFLRNREPNSAATGGAYDQASLKESVRQAFEARQSLLRQELVEFQSRINRLSRTLDERERLKNEIINHRVNELLNPNLKWESADSAPSTRAQSWPKSSDTMGGPGYPGMPSPQTGAAPPAMGPTPPTTTPPRSDSSFAPSTGSPGSPARSARPPRSDSGLGRPPFSTRSSPDDRGERFEAKVFKIQHAKATELSRTLQELNGSETFVIRTTADAATNTLIVFAKPGDLSIVEALVKSLDIVPAGNESRATGGGPPVQPASGDIQPFQPFQSLPLLRETSPVPASQ